MESKLYSSDPIPGIKGKEKSQRREKASRRRFVFHNLERGANPWIEPCVWRPEMGMWLIIIMSPSIRSDFNRVTGWCDFLGAPLNGMSVKGPACWA